MKRAKTQQLYHKKKYLWKGQSESTYRHNNWLVLIEERLITGGGVNNCESLMSQVAITVLVQSTPVWATMLQSMEGQNKTKIISNWNSTFVQPKKLLIIFYHKFFCFFFCRISFLPEVTMSMLIIALCHGPASHMVYHYEMLI